MKRLLALVLGGLGLRALLKRRSPAALGPTPADELRARLAATKEPDPVTPGPPADANGIDARRADVHARARKALDDLKE